VTLSNSFAFTAFIIASSPGRLSLPFAPLMPASSETFQISHPDLSATALNSRHRQGGDRWIHEIEFDTYRGQLHIAKDDIKVFAQLAGRPIERRLSNSLERANFGHLREF
jgi:ATP-dependent DNA ligase